MNNNLYEINDKKEKYLWNNAIFVFDSSALLDFYFLPQNTRKQIFNNLIGAKLKNRLWIPSHVKFEYNKNRANIIKKPISENYATIKKGSLNKITKSIDEIENTIHDLKNRTKKDDKHPHLKQDNIEDYIKSISDFKITSDIFKKNIIDKINLIESEITESLENDDVLDAIIANFKIGREYSYDEIIDITKEGKHRYEFSIPPGYKDLHDKIGTQIFGDLIVWKQIIEYASETSKPIIFICNDLKEDWCYLEKKSGEKRIKSPREELIKEIHDKANVEFWMYNLPQFLYKSNEYLADTNVEFIDHEKIIEFSQSINFNIPEDDYYECEVCEGNNDGFGNIVRDWYERDIINEFDSSHKNSKYNTAEFARCDWCNSLHVKCPECDSVTGLPEMRFLENIECEGGCGMIFYVETDHMHDYESECDIYIKDYRERICVECQETFIDKDGDHDMCHICAEKYNQK